MYASPAGLERDRRAQMSKLLAWERTQGQPNIAGIEWTPVRRIRDELQQGIIATIDFGHRLALRVTTGGARARYSRSRSRGDGKSARGRGG